MDGGSEIKEIAIDGQDIWSVSDLVFYLRTSLEADQQLKRLWVKGEISNFIHHERSGHMYFTLKDNKTKIKAAMFARRNRLLHFTPKNGDAVFVRGKVSVYERDGQMQLYVQEMQMSGVGDLYLAYEQLKEKLAQAGYFTAPKKDLPRFPQKVGVITSANGAVIRDIMTTMKRRFPAVNILLYPVPVQGEGAAEEIAAAIDRMNQLAEVDVLIIGRGGGSLEELWAFNEEVVAESIYRSTIPVVSAVGHETDTTISDFVADVRAPTPTAAAELVVPSTEELMEQVQIWHKRLTRSIHILLKHKKDQLAYYQTRPIFDRPHKLYIQYEQRLDALATQLKTRCSLLFQQKEKQLMQVNHQLQAVNPIQNLARQQEKLMRLHKLLITQIQQQLKDNHRKLLQLIYRLDALSPLKVMQRGYSLVYRLHPDELISSVEQTQVGDLIRVRLVNGELKCQIWSVEEQKDET